MGQLTVTSDVPFLLPVAFVCSYVPKHKVRTDKSKGKGKALTSSLVTSQLPH